MHVFENMHQNKRLAALKIASNKILLARAHQKSSMIHRWSQKTHGLLKAVLLVFLAEARARWPDGGGERNRNHSEHFKYEVSGWPFTQILFLIWLWMKYLTPRWTLQEYLWRWIADKPMFTLPFAWYHSFWPDLLTGFDPYSHTPSKT